MNSNGASLQFTLTCISTGAPATTVTSWTRDSNLVFYCEIGMSLHEKEGEQEDT